MSDHAPVRLTPQAEKLPRVSEVANGNVRVYWHFTQGIAVDEPPTYTAPTDWPVVNTILRRPKTVRVLIETGGGGGSCDILNATYSFDPTVSVTTGEKWAFYLGSVFSAIGAIVDDEMVVNDLFCSCADPVFQVGVQTSGDEILVGSPDYLDAGAMNAIVVPAAQTFGTVPDDLLAIDPITSIATAVATPGGCGPPVGSGGGSVEDWEAAATAVGLAPRIGFVADDTLPTAFLSPVSPHTDDVPASTDDVDFIGGEVLNVLVFSTDAALDAYDPDTVMTETAAVRISDSKHCWKGYRTILLVDLSGSTTQEFRDQLSDIATALASLGFRYQEFDGTSIQEFLSTAVNSFFN